MSKQAIGLDISDYSIEVVVIEKVDAGFRVVGKNRVILEESIVKRGRIRNMKKLAQAINEVFAPLGEEARNSEAIIFGLSEAQVYTQVFKVKVTDSQKFQQQISQEVESLIPISKDKIYYTYKILEPIKADENAAQEINILLVATDFQVFTEWQQFFKKINLSVKLFDIEALATWRGLNESLPDQAVAVLDLGARTSQLSVFCSAGLIYSYTIPYAGEYFTTKVAQALKMDETKAEEIKKKYGLTSVKQRPQLKATLELCLEHLLTELKRNLAYLKEKNFIKVEELILVGGSSNMPGLFEFIIKSQAIDKVSQGRVARNEDIEPIYIESIGLAKRALDKKWDKTDPGFFVSGKDKRRTARIPQAPKSREMSDKYNAIISLIKPLLKWTAPLVFVLTIVSVFLVWLGGRAPPPVPTQDLYAYPYSVNIQIPVDVNPKSQVETAVKGRVATNTIKEAINWQEAVNLSRGEISQLLVEGEKIWPGPINTPSNTESLIFPLLLNWLIYKESELGGIFITELSKRQSQEVDIIIKEFKISNLESSQIYGVYNLKGAVEIVSKHPMSLTDAVIAVAIEEGKQFIRVLPMDIPLNVRAGPSTSYDILTEINSLEEYELLNEENDWQKLKINESEGWVYSLYTEKL